jgi:hypothetical protein
MQIRRESEFWIIPLTQVAFWKSLADDLFLDPPCYVRVQRVLGEIRDGIADLGSGGRNWKNASTIKDVLDVDLIQGQLAENSFSWESCVKLVHDVMTVINPFPGSASSRGGGDSSRNIKKPRLAEKNTGDVKVELTWPDVSALLEAATDNSSKQPHAFCSSLEFLLDRTHAIRIGVANHRLQQISPLIHDHGIEYEKKQFEKQQGLILSTTRTWLRETLRTMTSQGRFVPKVVDADNSAKSAAFSRVLKEAVVLLITGPESIISTRCPETLLLDVKRLVGMSATFHLCVLISSIMVISSQKIDAFVVNSRQKIDALRKNSKDSTLNIDALRKNSKVSTLKILGAIALEIMEQAPRASNILAAVNITERVIRMHFSLEDEDTGLEQLCKTLRNGCKPNMPVMLLMQSRLRMLLLEGLVEPSTLQEEDKAVKAYDKCNLPKMLMTLLPQFRLASSTILKIMNLNEKIHHDKYNDMLNREIKGFITWRFPISSAPVPPGFRIMTVGEAELRLKELFQNQCLGSASVRLLTGRIEAIAPGQLPHAVPLLPWKVVTDQLCSPTEVSTTHSQSNYGENEVMIMPLSVNIIHLSPGAPAPSGFRLMTASEAGCYRWHEVLVTEWLQEWSIVRLEGGKLDGFGYGGKLTHGDFTSSTEIGQALIVAL